MGDIDPAPVVKLFASYVVSKKFPLVMRVDVRQFVGGADGAIGDVGAYMPLPGSSKKLAMFAGPSITFADHLYMQKEFGVSATQALGLQAIPQYESHPGIEAVGLRLQCDAFHFQSLGSSIWMPPSTTCMGVQRKARSPKGPDNACWRCRSHTHDRAGGWHGRPVIDSLRNDQGVTAFAISGSCTSHLSSIARKFVEKYAPALLRQGAAISRNPAMRFRLKAFGLHLLGSCVVLTLVLGTLYFGWYRWPGWFLADALPVVMVLAGVDLALGPLLTFVIAQEAKPRRALARDVAIIVAVQLCALVYGAVSLWHGRPLYYAFSEDVLQLVQAYDIGEQEWAFGPPAEPLHWLLTGTACRAGFGRRCRGMRTNAIRS